MLIRLVCGSGSGLNKCGIYRNDLGVDVEELIEVDYIKHPTPWANIPWFSNKSNVEIKYDTICYKISNSSVTENPYIFAFNGINQLKKWFCFDDLKTLEDGLKFFEYIVVDAKDFYYTKEQAIFRKQDGNVIASFKTIEELNDYFMENYESRN